MSNFDRARAIMELVPVVWPKHFGERVAVRVEIAFQIQKALDEAERRGRDLPPEQAEETSAPVKREKERTR